MVELIHWPTGDRCRVELAARSKLCLLLVDPDGAPPTDVRPTEDWIRLPAREDDIATRIGTLERRGLARPTLDAHGTIHTGIGSAPLPALEARITAAMLDRFGQVTDRRALFLAGWPSTDMPPRNSLDVHLHRLRRRIEPIGLHIRTVRKRGYVLESAM